MTTSAADFLRDHCEGFKCKSNVKELALSVTFEYDKENLRTWWGTRLEATKDYRSGNRKSESVYHFLQSTKQLVSFEMEGNYVEDAREGDETIFHINCISSMTHSRLTMKTLTITGSFPIRNESVKTDYALFKNVKLLNLELFGLVNAYFPESLEVLGLLYYCYDDSSDEYRNEDFYLKRALGSCPSIREAAVPAEPFDSEFDLIKSPAFLTAWKRDRKALEELEPIKSGKVKLTLLKAGLQCESFSSLSLSS